MEFNNLFNDGVPNNIGRFDEEQLEKQRKADLEHAKQTFTISLEDYLRRLFENKLIDKEGGFDGQIFYFSPERFVKLGMKDEHGNYILQKKDVLDVLGVGENDLKSQIPTNHTIGDGKYILSIYETNNPFLVYIEHFDVENPSNNRTYFQLTDQKIKEYYEDEQLKSKGLIRPEHLSKPRIDDDSGLEEEIPVHILEELRKNVDEL